MEETSAEEPSVTNQECTDKLEMQEHQVDDEECHAPLAMEAPVQVCWTKECVRRPMMQVK